MKSKFLFLLTAAAAVMVLATGCGNKSGASSSSSTSNPGSGVSSSSSSSLGSPSSGTSSNDRVDYDEIMNGNSGSGAVSGSNPGSNLNSSSHSGSDSNPMPGSSGSAASENVSGSSGMEGASNSGSGSVNNGTAQSGQISGNAAHGSSNGSSLGEDLEKDLPDPTPDDDFATDPDMLIPESSSSIASNMSYTGSIMGTASNYGSFPTRGLDWGPGGPVDSLNRSQGALVYNGRYGKYNALFIGPEQKTVYMTFDEGYENGLSNTFLDILKEKQVKAMFFVTYDFVHRNPELVQRMIAEGHIVGSHSWSHKNYSTLTPDEMKADLAKMHDYVQKNFNYQMKYFRFPSGNFSEQALAVVKDFGYRSIFWSFAYVDWNVDSQPQPEPSFQRVMKALCPGNIYLFHAVSSTNAQILPSVIDAVRAAGYQWGDPDELGQVVIPSPV